MLRDTTGIGEDLTLGRQILGVEMLPMKEVSHICKLVQGVIDGGDYKDDMSTRPCDRAAACRRN